MRKAVFLFVIAVLAIIPARLRGQGYVPFPTEKAEWNVYYVGTCEERSPDTLLLRYAIQGDTIINGAMHKKLCLESGDLLHPKFKAIGGIREAGKKIYYQGETILSPVNDKTFLLYDFTTHKGDTIKHDPKGRFYTVVLNVDSILIDGAYRKKYEVKSHGSHFYPDWIIEGIGSVKNGLLGHISDVPTCGTHHWEHICFKENGSVKYLNPSFSNCITDNFLMHWKTGKADLPILIFPNPATQQIVIEKNANIEWSVKIIDANGQIVEERPLFSNRTSVQLNFNPGIYLVLITDKFGELVSSHRLVKQ